jgi:hypothetical protein
MKKIIILPKNSVGTRKMFLNIKGDISLNELTDINNNFEYINKLFMNIDFAEKTVINNEIKKKISSYRSQDLKKKRLNITDFITTEYIIQKLVECKMKCYYCKCNMKLIYKQKRDTQQWTVDRIENHIGHNFGNIVISCMSCNLKKRHQDSEKFKFSKQMQLIKSI